MRNRQADTRHDRAGGYMRAIITLALILVATTATAKEYRNTKNPRDGWKVTPDRITGTGQNVRHGYQRGANGAWYGTGKDFGKIYR